jgi:hypothetical protein
MAEQQGLITLLRRSRVGFVAAWQCTRECSFPHRTSGALVDQACRC